ncbi:MAG: glycosyltransferase family 2 protein [Candidatus Magasanikbacteria bacterium]
MLEKNILFSIVIPAYNEEKKIKSCLDHAKKLHGNFSYEIIVVDNNSTDNTILLAKEGGADVVILEKKQGVGAARRAGTAIAKGIYVLHIDADTHLPEDYLIEVLKRFEEDPYLVCLGGQMYFYDAPFWKNVLRVFIHRILWFFAVLVSKKTQGPMGNNMTFINSIYKETSGFDDNLRFGEDMDITKKLSEFGHVKLDMALKCPVSSRRFKINKNLFYYSLNFLSMITKSEPIKNELLPASDSSKKDYKKIKELLEEARTILKK